MRVAAAGARVAAVNRGRVVECVNDGGVDAMTDDGGDGGGLMPESISLREQRLAPVYALLEILEDLEGVGGFEEPQCCGNGAANNCRGGDDRGGGHVALVVELFPLGDDSLSVGG